MANLTTAELLKLYKEVTPKLNTWQGRKVYRQLLAELNNRV